MHFLITDIKFDCSLDDEDWTIKDQLETEEMLPHSYIGSTWEADDEDDLLEEISCASGWLISELDYKIVLNQQPVGEVAQPDPQTVRPCAYNRFMKTNNPYEQQILAKGRDLPKAQPSTGKVPARFADRFATFEEYQEAMADFLNGN